MATSILSREFFISSFIKVVVLGIVGTVEYLFIFSLFISILFEKDNFGDISELIISLSFWGLKLIKFS